LPGSVCVLFPDACLLGVGGVLFQVDPLAGSWGILSFFSRKLTDAERRYPIIELEALGILYCLSAGRKLISGPVHVYTDHSSPRL
jgi:hypothetical protein